MAENEDLGFGINNDDAEIQKQQQQQENLLAAQQLADEAVAATAARLVANMAAKYTTARKRLGSYTEMAPSFKAEGIWHDCEQRL